MNLFCVVILIFDCVCVCVSVCLLILTLVHLADDSGHSLTFTMLGVYFGVVHVAAAKVDESVLSEASKHAESCGDYLLNPSFHPSPCAPLQPQPTLDTLPSLSPCKASSSTAISFLPWPYPRGSATSSHLFARLTTM